MLRSIAWGRWAGAASALTTALAVGVGNGPAHGAVVTTGHPGPYVFSTSAATGEAGACTYGDGVLSRIIVKPPLAKERAVWTIPINGSVPSGQYVYFYTRLYGYKNSTWTLLKTFSTEPLLHNSWTRMPTLPPYISSNGLAPGYFYYRVQEQLRWIRPDIGGTDGTATVTLANYWDGRTWLVSCPSPPNPATTLIPTSKSDSSIGLSWVNPTSGRFAGSIVRYAKGTVAPVTKTAGTGLALTHPTDNSVGAFHLDANTPYSFAIWTYDTFHHYSKRLTLSNVMTRPLPGAVTGLSATPLSTTSVQLNWTNPSSPDLKGVKICRNIGTVVPTSTCTPLLDQVPALTTYTDTSASPGTTYTYAVFAHDSQNRYAPVASAAVNTLPDAVSALSAVASGNQVQLSWTNPANPTFAKVKICRADGSIAPTNPTSCTQVGDTATSPFIDTPLPSGTTYSYALFAHDATNTYSAVQTVTITTAPAAVTNLGGTATASQVQLTWTDPADTTFTGVKVCRAEGTVAPTDPLTCSEFMEAATSPFTDMSVMPGTTYSYTLFAHDAANSYATGVSTLVHTTPGPVTQVVATPSATQVQLTWVNPTEPDVTAVKICRGDGMTVPDPTTCTALNDTLTTQFTDSTVASGTTYTYALFAHDDFGDYSVAATDTVSTNPSPVSNLVATPGAGQVQLSWTNPSDPNFTGVRVCRADGALPPSNPLTCSPFVDQSGSPYTDMTITAGTQYSYAVFTHDAANNYSVAATVTVQT